METLDWAMLFLRLVVGATILTHGIRHAKTQEGTTRWFEKVGFRSAALQARVSALGEIAAGLGLITGLLTSFAAAGVVATMVIAAGSIHRFNGFFSYNKGEGWEYVNVLGSAALVVAWLGAGAFSLDRLFGLEVGNGVGLLVGVGGIVAGIVQLLLFWRRPQ